MTWKPYLRHLWLTGQQRRFLYITYRRDALMHGSNPLGWHATNIALHVIATALVYAILRGLFSLTAAALGTAIFAAHPVATSAVASISGRSSLLCGVFYLAALLAAMIGGWAWLAVPPLLVGGWHSKYEILAWPAAAATMLLLMR